MQVEGFLERFIVLGGKEMHVERIDLMIAKQQGS